MAVNLSVAKKNHDQGARARVDRVSAEMEAGLRFAEKFDEVRMVTFYGSARTKPDSKYYKMAYDLAAKLAKDDSTMGVVTGGGPGIMEAGNRGAKESGGYSIGLGIELPNLFEVANPHTTHRMDFHYFFTRKVTLVHISQAYVFFPGGVGTMDEFFELITLITTKKIEDEPMVILMGKDYWEGLFKWLDEIVVDACGCITKGELESICHMTDDVEEAYQMLDRIPLKRLPEVM